ncbi:MAG: GNAT family N-acetyltransferase [Oscillospiraceae bacterium]|nr:GNAT family N-acetyltransferase [Oscillospiraceae bacterium]MBR0211324.1 GNAT family N-acetyltransferase [Oscillospiraceae bacterium]
MQIDKSGEKSMNIKPFEESYRDDLIFMVLQAKDALGRKPRINEDLLDIKCSYLDRGDMFWIAVDASDRVIGCIGYSRIGESDEAFLHRLYVKAANKHAGIGTRLLTVAEASMKARGINVARVHLGEPKEQWYESYSFYPKNGYKEYAPRYMMKRL